MQASAIREAEAVEASGKPWLQVYATANEANIVDGERLEAALEKIRSKVKNPAHGVFGPGSMMWKIYGEQAATGVGGLRAVLLQTAHPYIAHGVQQKSAYRTDTQGRNERTVRAVINWIYGDLDRAFTTARTVWRVHSYITGEIANRVGPYDAGDPYAANEQHALFWVHATGVDTAALMYEHIYGPLSRAELDQYHEESKLFALLFGVDEAIVPPTWGDFREYMDRMFDSDVLTPDQASRDIAKYVLSPPVKKAAGTFRWLKIMTAGLLPPRVRHGYQLPWGRFEERVFEGSMKALKTGVPMLPWELRRGVAYRKAMHRAEHTSPGLLEQRVNEAIRRLERAQAKGMKRKSQRLATA